jgi:hypothetical protein
MGYAKREAVCQAPAAVCERRSGPKNVTPPRGSHLVIPARRHEQHLAWSLQHLQWRGEPHAREALRVHIVLAVAALPGDTPRRRPSVLRVLGSLPSRILTEYVQEEASAGL